MSGDWVYIDEATGPEFENGWTNAPNPKGPRAGETLFDHVDRHLKALEDEPIPGPIFTLPPGYVPYSYWHRRRLTHPVILERTLPLGFALVRVTGGRLRVARASRVEVLSPQETER